MAKLPYLKTGPLRSANFKYSETLLRQKSEPYLKTGPPRSLKNTVKKQEVLLTKTETGPFLVFWDPKPSNLK